MFFSSIKTMKWERSKLFKFRGNKEGSGDLVSRSLFLSLSLLLWETVNSFPLEMRGKKAESAASTEKVRGELSFPSLRFCTCPVGSDQWVPDQRQQGQASRLANKVIGSQGSCSLVFFWNCFSRTNVITEARTDMMTELRSCYYNTEQKRHRHIMVDS